MNFQERSEPTSIGTGASETASGRRAPTVQSRTPAGPIPVFLVGGAVFLSLLIAAQFNYLLFHALAESFSIVVGCAIFMVAWNSRAVLERDYLLFLGIAYLFVAGLDFLHMLTYKGMGVFPGYDANLPTQVWISARYMESLSLFMAPLFLGRRLKKAACFAVFAGVTAIWVLAVFHWKIFPDCFLEGRGLTPFKRISEYVISLIFLASAVFLARNGKLFEKDILRLLLASILVSILAEISFTLYMDVYGLSNLAGHFLKIASFALIYRAVVETGVVRPHALLFRDLKESEEIIRRSRDELELRVQDRTAQLRKYAAQLEWRNRELQEFAYVASHDLQEPLRKVQMFGDMLMRETGASLSDKSMDYLKRIIQSARRMQDLIKDLLDYSRTSTTDEPFGMMDLQQPLGRALANLEAAIRQAGARIKVDHLPRIEGDPNQMAQLFQNLVGNALKFRLPGRLPTIEIYGRRSESSRQNNNGFWDICVKDDGIGFDEQYLDQIFRPFVRLHGRNEYEGTGIGLAICEKIAGRHGGRITARSAPGRGSTFIVTLPGFQGGHSIHDDPG